MDEIITFSESDVVSLIMPQSEALLMSLIVANDEGRKVYVDYGALVNIIVWEYFQMLGLKKDDLK